MSSFDPDLAIFGILVGRLGKTAEETKVEEVNRAGIELYSDALQARPLINILQDVLGDTARASRAYGTLLETGSLIVEGKLNKREIQLHSRIVPGKQRFQAAIMDTSQSRRAQEGFEYAVGALARASEVNDTDTGHHILRVNQYAKTLAELLGQRPEFVSAMELLSQLHDVGKLHIDRNILCKPGRLAEAEFKKMQQHTMFGVRIIGKHERLALAAQIALGHHEKWDGTGYPNGLCEEMTPLSARIVAIVDVFDALVSIRPYKPAFSYERTWDILTNGDDRIDPERHFDPRVHKMFLEHYKVFTQIHSRMMD